MCRLSASSARRWSSRDESDEASSGTRPLIAGWPALAVARDRVARGERVRQWRHGRQFGGGRVIRWCQHSGNSRARRGNTQIDALCYRGVSGGPATSGRNLEAKDLLDVRRSHRPVAGTVQVQRQVESERRQQQRWRAIKPSAVTVACPPPTCQLAGGQAQGSRLEAQPKSSSTCSDLGQPGSDQGQTGSSQGLDPSDPRRVSRAPAETPAAVGAARKPAPPGSRRGCRTARGRSPRAGGGRRGR